MKKLLTLAFVAATMGAGVISVHALAITAAASPTCGVTCVAPQLSCPGGCFCHLGSGIDTGVCMPRK